MPARLLDGAAVAAAIVEELKPRVEAFRARRGRAPALGIVLVGHDPASEIYVRNKMRTGAGAGVAVRLERLPATATLPEVVALVRRLNQEADIDGILVQSPLPLGREAAQAVFDAIDPAKDVDGFHPLNTGLLAQHRPRLAPCTPSGIVELLDRSGIAIAGARAVVLGRSEIVGRPLALMLLQRHATVTICHSQTRDLARVAREGDILVAAIGRPAMVTAEFVRPGATVIDVGITRVADGALVERLFPPGSPRRAEFERRGSVVVGDVHPAVAEVAGALTPVPGGVGPLTVAMLVANTIRAAELRDDGAGGG